jgi:chromosome segregation and condensation protein ScpB/DNA-binding XRE family transcriptional regulator
LLGLTLRQAAKHASVSPSVLCEIEHGRRAPSIGTYAKLREALGLEVSPVTAAVPPRPRRVDGDHLAALAACLVVQRGGPLADFAAALDISIAAVREGVLGVADRLAAIGLEAVIDDVEVRLAPLPTAAAAVGRLTELAKIPQVTEEQLEVICVVAHLGAATRGQVEARLGRDCETVLRRMLDRGVIEKVDTGSPAINHYRVTTKAIAATGHADLASLRGFLAESLVDSAIWR